MTEPTVPSRPQIVVRNIRKSFQDTLVLDGFSSTLR